MNTSSVFQRVTCAALILLLTFGSGACVIQEHQVGAGASGTTAVSERQWYALWGLIKVNDVNSKTMAGTATSYTVRDEYNAGDVLIGIFTIIVSFIPRTTTVTK